MGLILWTGRGGPWAGAVPDIRDMIGGRAGERVVDSETLIRETQRRVAAALKEGYEYVGPTNESDRFLRRNVWSRVPMVTVYVDLVGSTQMTLELPSEKMATIISSFAQEMASVIHKYGGYVLKFVGDAVVGYFVAMHNPLRACDSAVTCAKSMISVIRDGINPVLAQYDYPELRVKVGMDYGENVVARYGSDPEKSHVDIIGPVMNIAAKIQATAKPDQILVGDDVHARLHPDARALFRQVVWKHGEWKYRSRVTGDLYRVYEYSG